MEDRVTQKLGRYYSTAKGEKLAEFFQKRIRPLHDLDILEIGCSAGQVSIPFAQRCKNLTGIDLLDKSIELARQRAADLELKNSSFFKMNFLSNTFLDASFDVVIVNGVLEWVGKNDDNLDPEDLQMKFLREAQRVLRENGILYLGIENRWSPYHVFVDPHTGLPLVAILPRRLSDIIYRILRGRSYQFYVHSYRKLKKMLQKSGFNEITFYIPIFNYHFPLEIVEASDARGMARVLLNVSSGSDGTTYEKWAKGRYAFLKKYLFLMISLTNLQKIFANCFIVIAGK